MKVIKLGELLETGTYIPRDAVHVAILPVLADEPLDPGDKVGLSGAYAKKEYKTVGVIDPFLKRKVHTGERCWLFMMPETVTNLRHLWSHKEVDDDEDMDSSWEDDDGCRGC